MSKTQQQIKTDLDTIIAAVPAAAGIHAFLLNTDSLAQTLFELQSSAAINPTLIGFMKMSRDILTFIPPYGAIVGQLLDYVIKILGAIP